MKRFADLLERLVLTPARSTKLALLDDWIATEADPDRGIGLAALTGELSFAAAKAGLIRALAAERTDPVLFALSYDFVGDLAETVSLMWPAREGVNAAAPSLAEVAATLATARKEALAWPAVAPPYLALFDWLERQGPQPRAADAPVFRPAMLATPLDEAELAALDPALYRAEWKWDGIRVQCVATRIGARLWSRGGEDITAAFPEIAEAMAGLDAVLDGELLVVRQGSVAPFSDLQQRLNRKAPGPKLIREHPAHVRLYDMLFEGGEDIRGLPFDARRARLEAWFARAAPPLMDLSALVPFSTWDELAAIRAGAREAGIEGLMLKRADSAYLSGRPKGPWFKWKRDPLTIDAVLMYAQRGHGKRSSFYSDYTFGVWRGDELVPVGKAYSGFTDQELAWLDRWIRNNTTGRYGPVREVEKALVLEVAFDAAQLSARHRSGVALRFPRISRIRTDKPAAEADRLEAVLALVDAGG